MIWQGRGGEKTYFFRARVLLSTHCEGLVRVVSLLSAGRPCHLEGGGAKKTYLFEARVLLNTHCEGLVRMVSLLSAGRKVLCYTMADHRSPPPVI